MKESNKIKNIAILTSRSGRNANDIINAIEKGLINANIACIIGNRSHCEFIEKIKKTNYDSYFLDHEDYSNRDHFDAKLMEILKSYSIDIVVSCSFSRLLSHNFIDHYPSTINSHPSLLPAFPGRTSCGLKPVDAAFEYGVKFIGATVHFVDRHVDNGPIIIQAVTPVMNSYREKDFLKKILEMESRIKIQALYWLINDRLIINGRNISVKNEETKTIYNDSYLIYPTLDDGF
ncbi:phosphoribosylglycinamide formyltransferase [Vreelandella titanicae]|uniref:phosphoribosylglycinamide formyltransferase n=1 Tax=Vreelandella titanicae TaxID=664683 RepID=UPI0039BF5526